MLEVEPAWKSSLQQSLGCATWTTVKERRGLVVGCCGELSELTPGLISDSCCTRMRHPLDATAPRRAHRASIENTSLVVNRDLNGTVVLSLKIDCYCAIRSEYAAPPL